MFNILIQSTQFRFIYCRLKSNKSKEENKNKQQAVQSNKANLKF